MVLHFSARYASLSIALAALLACPAAQAQLTVPAPAASAPASAASAPDRAAVRLQRVEIIGRGATSYAPKAASSGTRTDTPLIETPMSVQVLPRQLLDDQNVRTISEAVRNVSGITPGSSPGQGFGDSFNIRGFGHGDATYEDGARFSSGAAGALPRVLANIERVEVLKGPASILYGQGEPGGLVNLVTKRPLDYHLYAFEQEFGSWNRIATQMDLTGPLTEGGTLGYRLNVAWEKEDSYRDFVSSKRFDLFPTLQWKASAQTTAGLQLHYGKGYGYLGDTGIPLVNGQRPNVPRSRNYNEPDLGRNYVDEYSGKLDWEHRFNDRWKVRHYVKFEDVSSLDNYNSAGPSADADADGNLPRVISGYDNDPTARSDTGSKTWNTGVDITGKFEAFGLKHTLLLGADYYRVNEFYGYHSSDPADLFAINIFNPVYFQPRPDVLPQGYVNHTAKAWGVYVQNQMEFPNRVHLLLGLRHDRARDDSHTDGSIVKDTPPVTPRFGLLWRPALELSLYTNYVENFGQTASGQFLFGGGRAPNETAQQFEAGVKSELFDRKLNASFSVYQITKQNVLATDPVHGPPFVIPLGEVRSRGFEVDIGGELRRGWDVTAAYSYIDSRTTKADPPELIGRTAGIPRHGANLFTTYALGSLLPGLRIGGGINVAGSTIDGVMNRLAGYTTASLFASYGGRVGANKLAAQVNVDNVFDKVYFPDNVPGKPRSITVSMRLEL